MTAEVKGNFNEGARMLMLNPTEGAVVLKSIGMFLERERRGSMPQAHTLLHRPARPKPVEAAAAEEEPRAPELGVYHLAASDILWSKKLRRTQRGAIMSVEKKPVNKSQPKLVDGLRKRTHFNRQEIECLCKMYRELVSQSANSTAKTSAAVPTPGIPTPASRTEGLDRVIFRELVHNAFDLVTEEVLVDRIFCAFDKNNDGVIKLDNWICGLSTFLRGTVEERAAFCFSVYDMNADGFVSRDEMMQLLRNCLIKSPQDEDPEEGVRDLVELVLRKIDEDKDGKISYRDFVQAVTSEPLLLEAFGQCLPTEAASRTFMSTLK